MPRDIVHVDVSGVCYRAAYSMPHLSYQGDDTAVLFGFLRWLVQMRREAGPAAFTFCFDSRSNHRKKLLSTYKANRQDLTDERKEIMRQVHTQRDLLRDELLPAMGFSNIVEQKGYEADDLIAAMVLGRQQTKFHHVIATGDHDLWQCLSDTCSVWNLRSGTWYTANHFRKEYGLEPAQWARVKAIAGCSSDNVPGIKGVGEKTAVRYLAGELSGARADKIRKHRDVVKRNKPLVKLPFRGCKEHRVRKDKVTTPLFKEVCLSYGLKHVGVW